MTARTSNLSPGILNGASWVSLDIETASKKQGSICEIAVVWRDAQGEKLGEYDTLVSLPQGFGFSSEFSQYHGITKKMTNGFPDMQTIMSQLAPCLRQVKILSHNSDFEADHLEALRDVFPGIEIPLRTQYVDTLRISRYTYPKESSHKLGDLAERYGIAYSDSKSHRALHDAKVLDEWFLTYVDNYFDGDCQAALDNYRRRPQTEGSYEWWRDRQPPKEASAKQIGFVESLQNNGYLSDREVNATDRTMGEYSKLIDRGVKRRDRRAQVGNSAGRTSSSWDDERPVSPNYGKSNGGCLSFASLMSFLFRSKK